jgi:hypothetical protein
MLLLNAMRNRKPLVVDATSGIARGHAIHGNALSTTHAKRLVGLLMSTRYGHAAPNLYGIGSLLLLHTVPRRRVDFELTTGCIFQPFRRRKASCR